jgi:hypothetical protein
MSLRALQKHDKECTLLGSNTSHLCTLNFQATVNAWSPTAVTLTLLIQKFNKDQWLWSLYHGWISQRFLNCEHVTRKVPWYLWQAS